MTATIAAHLLRSSSGGRGILPGGTPGVPPARVVVLGAGAVGFAAVRRVAAAGARVIAFDRDPAKRHVMNHVAGVETCLSDVDAITEAVASADIVIGAILEAGIRTPHIVTRPMVERMKPGSAIAQAVLPYLLSIAKYGVEESIEKCPDLKRGVYSLRGRRS